MTGRTSTTKPPSAMVVRPEAIRAWHHLGAALADLTDAGRTTPCSTDPDPFTSDDVHQRREAAAACVACPALTACRTFADHQGEAFGVWGGADRAPRATGPRVTPAPTNRQEITA